MCFMDLTEECGYSIAAQIALFHSIKPLFAGKQIMLVINKIDKRTIDDLDAADRAAVNEIMADSLVKLAQLSCYTDIGVMETRNFACDQLVVSF